MKYSENFNCLYAINKPPNKFWWRGSTQIIQKLFKMNAKTLNSIDIFDSQTLCINICFLMMVWCALAECSNFCRFWQMNREMGKVIELTFRDGLK